MIKETLKVAIALTVALSLAGCATLGQDINSVTQWLASPTTQAALQTLKVGTQVFVCNIASVSSLTQQIEKAIQAGNAVMTTTGQVATVSSLVCTALTGSISPNPVVVTSAPSPGVVTTAPLGTPAAAAAKAQLRASLRH